MTSQRWYAVHCKPKQDARAEQHLANQGYEVFRPLACVRRRGQGKMVNTIESFFPRYLFVKLDGITQDWAPIRSTRGVAGLVRFSDKPVEVPESVINTLHACMDEDRCIDLTEAQLKPNLRVRICEGPFRGHEGLFCSKRGEDRVIVLVSIMQQPQHLTLPEHAIEPA